MKFNKSKTLNEATIEQDVEKAQRDLDNEVTVTKKGDIEDALDGALRVSKIAQKRIARGDEAEFVNILFVGTAGIGKTARVKAWAKANNIHLVNKDAKVLDPTDLGGIVAPSADGKTVTKLAPTELDKLDQPNSVLFLDEFNRAATDVRGSLLTLINDHVINDPREDGDVRFLPNFLFTVAAINPASSAYATHDFDPAELSRFERVEVIADKKLTLQHFKNVFKADLKDADDDKEREEIEGRIGLAEKLLGSKSFKFDNAEEDEKAQENQASGLNPRSLAKLLVRCDGTKQNFLDLWNRYCNPAKKAMAERILQDYVDKKDKANDALNNHDTESDVFKPKEKNNWDKIRDQLMKDGANLDDLN